MLEFKIVFPSLNDFVLFAWVFGTLINWLVPRWESSLRKTAGNLVVVLMIWTITEFFITATPKATWLQIIYVLIAVAVTAAPIDIYNFIVDLVTKTGKKKLEDEADRLIKKETTETTVKTEQTTEIKKP